MVAIRFRFRLDSCADEQIGREQTSAGRAQQHGVKMGECPSILAREGSRAPENGAQGTSLQPAIDAVGRRCQRVLTPKAMHVNTARIPVGTYSHLQGRIDSPQGVRFEGAGRIRMRGLARRGRGSTWSKPTKGAEGGIVVQCAECMGPAPSARVRCGPRHHMGIACQLPNARIGKHGDGRLGAGDGNIVAGRGLGPADGKRTGQYGQSWCTFPQPGESGRRCGRKGWARVRQPTRESALRGPPIRGREGG